MLCRAGVERWPRALGTGTPSHRRRLTGPRPRRHTFHITRGQDGRSRDRGGGATVQISARRIGARPETTVCR
ncbi:hypothetical protein A3768_5245 (plasmid) [Ralstonia solanacearum]|nr:hypothetical protein F504_4139 [Ralstonia pseudosolanacearum FQY_4]ANH36035.1 hypothetical protein A3768_5245 [Ralstonia solanacearum]